MPFSLLVVVLLIVAGTAETPESKYGYTAVHLAHKLWVDEPSVCRPAACGTYWLAHDLAQPSGTFEPIEQGLCLVGVQGLAECITADVFAGSGILFS
jgi:hypothetical protein